MNEDAPKEFPAAFMPPVSSFTGPIAELIAQRMLFPPPRPGLLAVLDQFEILRVLGGGGMGIVLLARDSDTGRDVAIKLIKSDLVTNQNVVHRFLKEAGHLKRLRHTNVVPVQEISDRAEGPYFVMPYFEKGSLANRIKPGQPLDTESILDIAAQVAEGLSFAHRSGIIHRDLKPANILLTADGNACLADFGLARTLFNDTMVDVENRSWEGTSPYMSPAVAAGDAEDTRCDIYSFGALLYEMLTGHPPYQGRGTKEILDQIIAGPPKPITSLNPNADRGLVAVAKGCMARELRDRYADMRDVLKDLQRIKENKQPTGQRRFKSGAGVKLSQVRRVLKVIWFPACLAAIALLGWVLLPKERLKPTKITVGSPAVVTNVVFERQLPIVPANKPPELQTFQTPWGIAVDNEGNVFVADKDNCTICKITPAGVVTNLAGLAGNPGIANGTGNNARFSIPRGIAVDSAGNIYVTDAYAIRKITPGGVASTLAGLAGNSGSTDGPGTHARFKMPSGIAVDNAGKVYVADTHTIRKITQVGTNWMVTTLAGMVGHAGSANGSATNAQFSDQAKGIAVDVTGNVYVADVFNNMIRKITPAGVVSTLPGSANSTGTNATLFRPNGVAVDSAGNVYVADTGNQLIRIISPGGLVMNLAGMIGIAGNTDGTRTNAQFNHPQGVAVDSIGNVYVADAGNQTIRKVTPNGIVSTIAGKKLTAALTAPMGTSASQSNNR